MASPLAQEGAERGDAGSRPDHDDRGRRVRRQREAVRRLDIELERGAGRDALGEESRGDAEAAPLVDRVANGIDRERHPAGIGLRRGGDRVEPRLKLAQRLDERFRVGPGRREFLQRPKHVERSRVAVGIVSRRKRLAFAALLAAGHVGDELEQRVGRRSEIGLVQEMLAQRPLPDHPLRPRAELGDHRIDEDRMIGRKHAEAVADLVAEPARGKVDLDVPGLFLGVRRIEPAARQEDAFRRLFAGVPGSGCAGDRRGVGHHRRRGGLRLRQRGVELFGELLQRPKRLLAARRAEVQPLLLLEEKRVRVVGAVVAALAAILLRHRGHQARGERAALGHLEALVQYKRGIVPGRVAGVGEHRTGGRILRQARLRRPARAASRRNAPAKAAPRNSPRARRAGPARTARSPE